MPWKRIEPEDPAPQPGAVLVELDPVEIESLIARIPEADHSAEGFKALCPTCNGLKKLRAALQENDNG